MMHAEFSADNSLADAIQGPKKDVGHILCHQPKSFNWAVRGAGKHPWGAIPESILKEALARFDAICGITSTLS